jgi:hypothetical protein
MIIIFFLETFIFYQCLHKTITKQQSSVISERDEIKQVFSGQNQQQTK